MYVAYVGKDGQMEPTKTIYLYARDIMTHFSTKNYWYRTYFSMKIYIVDTHLIIS